jgi:hypothetical protein
MAPRVPSAADLGIGTTGVTTQVNTPLQQFKPPDLGHGPRELSKLGQGLQSSTSKVVSAVQSAQSTNEKRALLKYEAAVDALNNELLFDPQTGLLSKSGQAAIDRVQGQGDLAGGDLTATAGVLDTYKARLAAIKVEAGAGLTQTTLDTLDLAADNSMNKFTAIANKKQIEAQNEVDAALIAEMVSRAAENASILVGQPTNILASGINKALEQAKRAALDPDIGSMKDVTDPKLRAEAVKKNQGIVAHRVISNAIATGRHDIANELISQAISKGTPTKEKPLLGVLAGTKEGNALQASLLTVQQKQKFANKFAVMRKVIVKDNGTEDITKLYTTVTSIKDIVERTGMMAELKTFLSARNAVTREQTTIASTEVLRYILKNGTLEGVNPTMLAQVAAQNPALLMPYLLGNRHISNNQARGRSADALAYEKSGGHPDGSNDITAHFKTMGDRSPADFLALMKNPAQVRALVNFEEFQELKSKRSEVEEKIVNIDTGKQFALGTFLSRLGFTGSLKKKADLLTLDTELRTAINDQRRKIFEATGHDATDEDLRPIIAQHLVKVRFDTGETTLGYKHTDTDFYTLSKAEADGIDVTTLQVGTGAKNLSIMAQYFGVTKAAVEEATDLNSETATPNTLRSIGSKLGTGRKQSPSLAEAMENNKEFDGIVIEAGYPPDFVAWAIEQKDLPYTEANVLGAIRTLQENPKRFSGWMRDYLHSKGQ